MPWRPFLETPSASAVAAFETSAVLAEGAGGGHAAAARARRVRPGVVGLDFDASVAWPAYDWAGVSKAALESINRYPRAATSARAACARTSSPPARCRPWRPRTSRASTALADMGPARRPLGWDLRDPEPVGRRLPCSSLSPLARAISGEILHVDGGVHRSGRGRWPPRPQRSDVVRRTPIAIRRAKRERPRGERPGAAAANFAASYPREIRG
jgi:enoyl-[acyl-carrier protein] reductase I